MDMTLTFEETRELRNLLGEGEEADKIMEALNSPRALAVMLAVHKATKRLGLFRERSGRKAS